MLVAAIRNSQTARYPYGPAPRQLPACLPWGAPAHLCRGGAGGLHKQCIPSSCHPESISLQHSFARICCSGGSFSKQGHILLNASKAALDSAKPQECHKSDENQTARTDGPGEHFLITKPCFFKIETFLLVKIAVKFSQGSSSPSASWNTQLKLLSGKEHLCSLRCFLT